MSAIKEFLFDKDYKPVDMRTLAILDSETESIRTREVNAQIEKLQQEIAELETKEPSQLNTLKWRHRVAKLKALTKPYEN